MHEALPDKGRGFAHWQRISNMASPRRDVYQEITNKIIAMLEEGKRPWLQPWQDGEGVASFPIRSTGEPYRGINVLLLWSEAADKGYNSPY
ncbi:hypothetical protein DEA98_29180 (plasmid) [Brucella pseudogrignonensis]|nr:hypothetical protein [Brucella pseudogrignonensis]